MAGKFSKAIEPAAVQRRLEQEPLFLVDVREPDEWEEGHIEGATHIPLGELAQRLGELPRDRELIMVCRSGSRSGLACEYMESLGYDVVNMTGGMTAWPGKIKRGR
ncbi:rhodanese-like domain-containing protein [Gorillibacterium sp. sgz500922]|uniref:rhodanese-like domain-containing protein n=1 Tax=Gorillibacterium sp. sgz500922 TaxID=3446694 RepID=UPI003F67D1D6